MNEAYLLPANEEEPFFTIRGRDPAAVVAIQAWIEERRRLINSGILPNTKEELDHIEKVILMVDSMRNYQPKSFGTTFLSNEKEIFSFTVPASMYNSILEAYRATVADFIGKKIHFLGYRTIEVTRITKRLNGDAIFYGTTVEDDSLDWTICLPEKN